MSRLVKLISILLPNRSGMNSLGPEIPIISRLSTNIIRILGCNPSPMTLQGTNTYLLGTGQRRILIDTGDPGIQKYTENLQNVLKSEKASVGTVILTHWHHDHVGGVNDVMRFAGSNCKIWKFMRTDAPDLCPEISPEVTIEKISDNQTFSVEGATVKAIHTPGHTTDHIVLLMNDGVLFSGDCILGEGTAVFEDLHNYMKSLLKIFDLQPTVIFPGHGNIVKDPITKIKYYIDHRNKRERQILELLEINHGKPFTEMDVVKVVYTSTPEALWAAAAFNVNHHLKKLTKEGVLVETQKEGQCAWIYRNKMESL